MRILLSAGEVSGDAIGSELAAAIHEEFPQAELAGCAGEAMLRAGVGPLAEAVDFSHAGWSSVLSRLPFLVWKAWRYLRAVDRFQPDLALVVDAPGLHGPLLRRLRSRGIPVAWVAPPQLWAWKNRRPGILDGLEVYPSHEFEQDSLRKAGAKTDVYSVFRRMLARGDVPDSLDALLAASTTIETDHTGDWR